MKVKHRVLVCGGRKYGRVPMDEPSERIQQRILEAEREKVMLNQVLNRLKDTYEIEILIHGAAKGADRLAANWAEANGIETDPYPIYDEDWRKHGKAAGMIRNKQMLDEGKPTLVVAFPGGPGTRNMLEQAKKAGLPTLEIQ